MTTEKRSYINTKTAVLPVPKILRLLRTLQREPLTVMGIAEAYGCSEKRVFPTLKVLNEVYGIKIKPTERMANHTRAAHGTTFKLTSVGLFSEDLNSPAVSQLIAGIKKEPAAGMLPIKKTIKLLQVMKATHRHHWFSFQDIQDLLKREGRPENAMKYLERVSKFCLINIEIVDEQCRLLDRSSTGIFDPKVFAVQNAS